MDKDTSFKCISCDAFFHKKLVKSLCPKCYRQNNKKEEICIDCKICKTDTFVKNRCQACRTRYDRLANPNVYAVSRAKNRHKKSEYDKEYASLHKKEKSAREAKRRSLKLNATPSWADLKEIEKIYKFRPSNMEVDHIIPLKGKLICGLHVACNLQYLTESENISKSNKFDGTKENIGWRAKW